MDFNDRLMNFIFRIIWQKQHLIIKRDNYIHNG